MRAYNPSFVDLLALYLETLAQCAPERLVGERIDSSVPRNVVAIGKCAGALLDGVAAVLPVEHAFAALPAGYRLPLTSAEVHVGGHPVMTAESFAAGRALIRFVEKYDDLLFLISGGGSACVELSLPPFTDEEVAARNAELIASPLPIAAINAARRERSAIKGGRLRSHVRGRCVTLVWSDVSTGALHDVASGPTITRSDPAILGADNATLTTAAARIAGSGSVTLEDQIEGNVHQAARLLVRRALELEPGQLLVAGGEPTVVLRGPGRGGRCSELALHFLRGWQEAGGGAGSALFAGSDGVDGNSGAAGIRLPLPGPPLTEAALTRSLATSDSFPIAAQVGEPIMIPPTGNNLRDLYLVARD